MEDDLAHLWFWEHWGAKYWACTMHCVLKQKTAAGEIFSVHIFPALISRLMALWFTTIYSWSSAKGRASLHPLAAQWRDFCTPLYVCEVGGYRWEEKLPSRTIITGWVGQRKQHHRDRIACLLFSLVYPIIKPLINSLVHREITQGPSWLQRRQLSASKWGSSPAFVFSFSLFLLLIFSLGPADTDVRWDANHLSFTSTSFTGG